MSQGIGSCPVGRFPGTVHGLRQGPEDRGTDLALPPDNEKTVPGKRLMARGSGQGVPCAQQFQIRGSCYWTLQTPSFHSYPSLFLPSMRRPICRGVSSP